MDDQVTAPKPTPIDVALVADLMAESVEVDSIIPPDPIDFLSSLDRLIRTGVDLGRGIKRWQIIVGRYAAYAKKHPEVWKHKYTLYGDFFHLEVIAKLGRMDGTGYNLKRLGEQYGEEPVERLEKIEVVNLNIASSLAKGKTAEEKEEILQKAETLEPPAFKAWAEGSRHSGPGELTFKTFSLSCNEAQLAEIEQILGDEDFGMWAGSDNKVEKILAALRTAVSEFGGNIPFAHVNGAVKQLLEDGDRVTFLKTMEKIADGLVGESAE